MPGNPSTSKGRYPTLVTAAVWSAAALSLWGAVQYQQAESAFQRSSPDPFRIGEQDLRFAEFRTAVPAAATLGYLTDAPPEDPRAFPMFLIAQYYLAPRLLQKSTAYDLVLGNFMRPADFAALGRQYGLRVERNFGHRVVLFRREAHP